MKFLIFLLFIFLTNIGFSASRPSWITNVQEGCKKMSELCAVGIGTGRDEAQRNAKIELSKIFSTNISSSFTSTLSAGSGQSSEEIQEGIKEETMSLLEGAEISKVHEETDAFYAYAVLNKHRAAESLKLKITDLDSEIKTIFDDINSASKYKIKSLYVKRQTLNQTYQFLTGINIPPSVASELIFTTSKAATKGMTLYIHLEEGGSRVIQAGVVKFFSDQGFKVVTGAKPSAEFTHSLTGKVIAEKQFLNVKGFRKLKVLLNLAVANSKKIETGHLNLESTTSGRTYSHCYELAVKEITNELKEKINDLNIE